MTSDEFTSRIHTTDLKTDWYRLLGETSLDKHLINFASIDWKNNYWQEDKAESFNFPDLEVLDQQSLKYLSISVCYNTPENFQFCAGLGTHNKNLKNGKVTRTVQLYGTATDNPDKVLELVKLFFNRDFDKLDKQIKTLDFLEEIEDLYQNIEKE
jgi:hypothetical protein